MKVLVNALSLGWLSGRHVLFGHLKQLATWTREAHEFLVLHRPETDVTELTKHSNISALTAPASAAHWTTRFFWEATALPRLMQQHGVNLYFSPTGTILPNSPAPQVTLAQNPWCLMSGLQKSPGQRVKAWIQRRAYRRAFREADLMVYNSAHMRELYQRNDPDGRERRFLVAYQGIDDTTHTAAAASQQPRRPHEILAVSVMAHWKGVEQVVAALAELRSRNIPATLSLVGPWADARYRHQMEQRIDESGMRNHVQITGQVSREQLHAHYARARVFCLMSRCESFGIPAVEAQAFGTPVVGSNVCAMPEIGANGGCFVSPDDIPAITNSLELLLTDDECWFSYSRRARENAARFRWDSCSLPLLQMFEVARKS